ncbi:biotin/lipoyl-binding protein [Nonomuraea fuscirosea]|uniref:acetyl/propionyl/methylcrotonyl-CoA carboxylase subunit alpha n=1 Tax=Nonomuraea fuscirosea TaxID=1291556 RepID=UPI002DD87CB3|nr:biotin carboxylase N-terminal domain-containing protein [Nonomuraea fuscirosea]WSA54761.1 biotin/lipoyl-binding protein [Nonomuraea fuscirosea]
MINRLLVANRGEIARRIFRTCRELGVSTVALFSDPDADAPHVAEADLAVRLPGAHPADTYLDAAAILAACTATGADAVHPGYGFLSENADFARAVIDAGLVWIGPPPEAIAAMGVKIGAKRLMAAAGVPVLPSYDLSEPAAVTVPDPASAPASDAPTDPTSDPMSDPAPDPASDPASVPVEFPLLVKASAGGGGRGMRVVRAAGELAREVESARREAAAAFGDGTVFAEPLLERARHVEVQVLADQHGTVWALGERECSVQRRHQKVIEECPAPGISPGTRELLHDAAVRAAREIGYVGAGTVEFLVDGERVAFLEMNTRLQVEHPVTELVHGVDLVRLQLEVAEGAALPSVPPEPAGWAVEARLYAEDSAYVPQSGVLRRFEIAGDVRVDSGVESGSVVSPYYDAMLAKVIAHGATREQAVRKLVTALRGARLHGLTTNRDLLVNILTNREFLAGDTHTAFLAPGGPLHPSPTPGNPTSDGPAADGGAGPDGDGELSSGAGLSSDAASGGGAGPMGGAEELAVLAAALAVAAGNRRRARVLGGLPGGWRNVRSQPRRTRFAEIEEDVVYDPLPPGVTVVRAEPDGVVLERDRVRHAFDVARYPDGKVCVDHAGGHAELTPLPRLPEPADQVAPGSLLAPMPGSVLRVEVEPGDRVTKGQEVLVLEAMKMEHRIAAPADGVVAAVHVEKGRQVDAGAVLAVIEEGDS